MALASHDTVLQRPACRRPARALLGAAMLASAAAASAPAAAADLSVVVTIKPLHALVAQVMAGVGTPDVLVQGLASAHTYALKPSDASKLARADVFFRMSEVMEPFTVKIGRTLPKRVQVVTLQRTRGLRLLPRRVGATFDEHEHHGHDDHDHDHGHRHHDHVHGATDGHAWLDPVNAKTMVDRIAQVLSAKAPSKATQLAGNANALKAKLDELSRELAGELAPIAGKPYIVFHDALQYFERRFGLKAVGSISVSPEVPPSAQRLSVLRERIMRLGAACVFAEPQFDRRLVDNVVEGTRARTGTIDPEGARIPAGPDLYFALLRNLARDLKACLAPG
jgi:zinc transport system substrate-binding protein